MTESRYQPMRPVATDDGWEARMAERARRRQTGYRESWPVPVELRGASARDAFLWYICDGWRRIFGDEAPIESLMDHDFGHHVLRKGSWQLTLIDLEQFPGEVWEG